MLKKARLLTRPILAATSPARPESAETASSPKYAPCPKQGRSSAADPRFTFHVSPFTVLENEAKTPLADFFRILLEEVSDGSSRTTGCSKRLDFSVSVTSGPP